MFENKILEIINKEENIKKHVIKELKLDSEINLFVDLLIEMINEKTQTNESIIDNKQELENEVKSENIKIQKLEEEINLKDENIEKLKNKVKYKDIEIKNLEQEVELNKIQIKKLQEEIKLKDKKLEELKEKGRLAVQEREEYKMILQEREIKSNKKIDELAIKLNKSEIEINYFKNRYNELENIHKKFNNLSESTKEGLSGIFKNVDSIDLFLFCGAEYDKLKMFWDFIKNEIINDKSKQDIVYLNEIFDYFFDRYNTISGGIYERVDASIGEEYDIDYHIRKGNKPSGEIKEVLLNGFRNKNTGKIIQKSVISL